MLTIYIAHILAYDPIASLNSVIHSKAYKETSSAIKALDKADALIICTEWKEFWSINTDIFGKYMKKAVYI